MDLNALRRMARKQRETEEAEDNIAPEATVKRVVPAEEPTADTEIYVPLEDDVVDPLPLPDDGYSVSSSVAEDEPKEEMAEERHGETLDDIIQKCFTDEKAYNIELERLLPFPPARYSPMPAISLTLNRTYQGLALPSRCLYGQLVMASMRSCPEIGAEQLQNSSCGPKFRAELAATI